MGLSIYMCDLIVQEHLYRSLPDTVHTIGRPFMGFNYDTLLRLLDRHHLRPASSEIEYDDFTTEAKRERENSGAIFISERTFFRSLGVKNVVTIDVSPYEGAELILDLNKPIADELEATADFIFGGSTLDNVFDPAQYIKNLARLLRPGGRLVEINIATDYGRPYVILPVPWYFDYFVTNAFDDAKIYVQLYLNALHYYVVNCPARELPFGGIAVLDNFYAGANVVGTGLIAEKGEASTWHVTPIQDAWRSFEQSKQFMVNLERMSASKRPVLSGFRKEGAAPVLRESAVGLPYGEDRPNAHYDYLGTYHFE